MTTAVSPWDTEAAEKQALGLAERMAQLKEHLAHPEKQDNTPPTRKPGTWLPGTSGNPNGRPKNSQCITSIARDMLDKPADLPDDAPESMKGLTWGELIALNWIRSSVKPVPPVLKELLDRVEGKVITPIEATGKDGMPIEVTIGARGKIADAITRLVARAGKN